VPFPKTQYFILQVGVWLVVATHPSVFVLNFGKTQNFYNSDAKSLFTAGAVGQQIHGVFPEAIDNSQVERIFAKLRKIYRDFRNLAMGSFSVQSTF
jgi:hypothetical protein